MRGDKKMTATLQRQFRPTVTEVVTAKVAPPVPAQHVQQVTSVADELAKLVKLKESGVLTDAEFQAQKQKLLAQ